MFENSNTAMQQLEEKARERQEKSERNRARLLRAGSISLSEKGYDQLLYEIGTLKTVDLTDKNDPRLKPLFQFYQRFLSNKDLRDINLTSMRETERLFFEAMRPILVVRREMGVKNPTDLTQWEADVYGFPLDQSLKPATAIAHLINSVNFEPQKTTF